MNSTIKKTDNSEKFTNWIGTKTSIVIHTIFFVGIFALIPFGVSLDALLLILTTAVSLEAIYLAIFIQMTVNRQSEDIEDIQEDIQEDDAEEDIRDKEVTDTLQTIEKRLQGLQKDIEVLKKKGLL